MNIKAKTPTLDQRVTLLEETIINLELKIESMPKPRDRGPTSTRSMNDEDAVSVCYGELKEASNKDAANQLGLSYAQVYSARGEYTFRSIHKQYKGK